MKILQHSTELACDVLVVVGYRAERGGQWLGPRRDTYAAARVDLLEHRRGDRRRP